LPNSVVSPGQIDGKTIMRSVRKITVTADDFGQSSENNQGVLRAHVSGIITTTSLMVGETGFHEAREIARLNPRLSVGLHICLSDGTPVSEPADIPLLVQPNGRFGDDERLLHAAALSRAGRAQIRSEIAQQFRKYFAFFIECDHVDVHRHSHRHPVVAREVFRAAAAWKVREVRIPHDPAIGRPRKPGDSLRYARIVTLRGLAKLYGIRWKDRVLGRDWKDPAVLTKLIRTLPTGSTELYFHPVVCDGDHRYKVDLNVFLDERVGCAVRAVEASER
jgi:predicted glycoside hydrolase/deacetylase ChbG (UPF0249 family)